MCCLLARVVVNLGNPTYSEFWPLWLVTHVLSLGSGSGEPRKSHALGVHMLPRDSLRGAPRWALALVAGESPTCSELVPRARSSQFAVRFAPRCPSLGVAFVADEGPTCSELVPRARSSQFAARFAPRCPSLGVAFVAGSWSHVLGVGPTCSEVVSRARSWSHVLGVCPTCSEFVPRARSLYVAARFAPRYPQAGCWPLWLVIVPRARSLSHVLGVCM